MIDYSGQLAAVIRATAFVSATRYAWFGRGSPALSAAVRRTLPPTAARHYLLYQLQGQLYRDFYRAGGAAPAELVPAPTLTGNAVFVKHLATANRGQGSWEPGWQPSRAVDGRLVVQRAGLSLWTLPGDCRPSPGVDPDQVAVRFPKQLPSISPGFYTALGDIPFAPAPDPLVRLYWHVNAQGALRLMTLMTGGLNAAAIPFRLKVVNDPAHFTRCDAAVLYVRKADYGAVVAVVRRSYSELMAHLRPQIPALTKLLAPGLGLAEDPGQGTSFGLHRCALLAEGLLRAREAGCSRPAARLQHVIEHLNNAGVSVEAPFLQPGSQDDYTVPISPVLSNGAPPPTPAPLLDGRACLEIAVGLGQRLVREAIWHGDQCNWMGAALREPAHGRPPTLAHQALGPDLYAGTSGIALFLAELGAVTGDPAIRRTAAGALRQALAQATTLPSAMRLSLYTGWIGIALAALRLGQLDHDPAWIEKARGLVRTLRQDYQVQEHDLLSGSAGTVLGLLVLAEMLADPELRHFAHQLGQGLVATAEAQTTGVAWRSAARPGTAPPLTGLSHGAAGIGAALVELYKVTGDPAFRIAGEGAYAYEQDLFDPAAGNWRDLRTVMHRNRGRWPPVYATYWCHGAPGIALTRLRAYEALHDDRYKAEAVAGINATYHWMDATVARGQSNFSLCHGMTGNVEVLLQGAAALGYERDRANRLAHTVAHAGIAHAGKDGPPWPCGVPGGETPGLLVGLAGIGLFYLRLYHPATPSILLPHSNMYA